MSFYEHYKRSLAKTISYRLLIISSDLVIIYFLTGRLDLAIGVITISNIASTGLYFIHERLWNLSRWGKHKIK